MSEIERDEFGRESIEKRRARRRAFWLSVAGASLVAAVASVIAIGGTSEARAMRGFFGHARGHGFHDPEAAREHAELAAKWLLRSVDASDAQQARVQEIVGDSVAELVPLAEQHRVHRETLLALLSEETIDRAALEALRAREFELADAASRALVASLADVAETLTLEQRAALLEHATSFHR